MQLESGHAGSLLIVEDDDGARSALGDIFGLEGYDVAYSCNGREALSHLRSSPLPNVIILDLQMPVMDGWQFRLEQKKDQSIANVPVIVVTAFHRSADIDAVAVMHKPIDVERLLDTVRIYC
jgi:CheY-like chemotaxis protein